MQQTFVKHMYVQKLFPNIIENEFVLQKTNQKMLTTFEAQVDDKTQESYIGISYWDGEHLHKSKNRIQMPNYGALKVCKSDDQTIVLLSGALEECHKTEGNRTAQNILETTLKIKMVSLEITTKEVTKQVDIVCTGYHRMSEGCSITALLNGDIFLYDSYSYRTLNPSTPENLMAFHKIYRQP